MNRRKFGLGLMATGVALAAPNIAVADDRYWLYATKKIVLGPEPWKDGWSPCQFGYLFDGDQFVDKMAITLGWWEGQRCVGYNCNIKRKYHDAPLTLFVGPGEVEVNKFRLSEPLVPKKWNGYRERNWEFGSNHQLYYNGPHHFESGPHPAPYCERPMSQIELAQDIRSSFPNSPLLKKRPLSLYI